MRRVRLTSGLLCQHPAAPMLDALAAGLRECSRKPITGERLDFLDGFLNNMLRSRISRRVLAEQHLMLDVPRCSTDMQHGVEHAFCRHPRLDVLQSALVAGPASSEPFARTCTSARPSATRPKGADRCATS